MVPHVISQLITKEHNHGAHDQIMEPYHSIYPFKQLPK